jgi:hypothetical protein
MSSMKNIIFIITTLLISDYSYAQTSKFKGHLSIWPESEVFIPCGSKKALWLDYGSKTREPLAKKHWELQKEPYGTTFAVIEGIIGPSQLVASVRISRVVSK